MNVIAIIVTYNCIKWIDRCLQSFRESIHPVHVIVIDNASTDDTVRRIREGFPEVEIVESKENIGFGRGNNIGLQKALNEYAEFVFLLNQDAWVEPDTIEQLVLTAGENRAYGILTPMHWNGDGSGLEIKFGEYINSNDTPFLVSDIVTGRPLNPVYESQFVNAAAWLISSECLMKVGGFDPLFNHYGEDEDFVRRIRFKGYRLGVVPSSRVFHDTVFKSWEMIKWDRERMMIIQILELKKLGATFRSCVLTYYKNAFNRFSDLLLYRKWKELKFLISVVFTTTRRLSKIKKSRKEALKERAFLEKNEIVSS